MIITTTNTLGDRDIVETLGMVRASTTWRRRIMKTYTGGIRSVEQNGMFDFDSALEDIKKKAMADMIESAKTAGATAVIGLSEQISEVTAGVFMVTVMGTAVRCQPKQPVQTSHSSANDNVEDVFHLYGQPASAATGGYAYRH